jgi:hypothetical protein
MNQKQLATLENRMIPSYSLAHFAEEGGATLIIPANLEEAWRPAFYRPSKSKGFRKLRIVGKEGSTLHLKCLEMQHTIVARCNIGDSSGRVTNIDLEDRQLQRVGNCPTWVRWEDRDISSWTYVHGGIIHDPEPENEAAQRIVVILSDTDQWREDRDLMVFTGTRNDLSADYVTGVEFRRNFRREDDALGLTDQCTLEKRWKIRTHCTKISFGESQIGKELWFDGERIEALKVQNPRFEVVPNRDLSMRLIA